ncbi:putative carboxypeptidase cpdS precursor [Melampsora larici-populina 98AG31]|uniref:Carboxypeptidase n=1 Tax=Melampsora larici-populina (strain 98AG31 / pathotype 3-4-7) TaxID=747676 RepID=F4RNN2_MELLP|nr:putative carboxypeptidase cpdS precursor [Melampsora larici-populina 98AG31]EGG06013.1 putative carboxypeptidase cpdS precursor [Melampsora larici-populina 98AG31]
MPHVTRAPAYSGGKRQFKSARAKEFLVDGKKLPSVDFDIGDSYAGVLPTSNDPKSPTKLFFWFLPSQTEVGSNDLTMFTNGGPGCSSLIGATSENGPLTLAKKITRNPYSWNTVSNVLYIEHPAPVGFSEGNVTIHNEIEIAKPIFGFLQHFVEVFEEMKNVNFWVSGESYAGYYVPYICDYIYAHQSALALSLQGSFLIDPVFSDGVFAFEIPAYPFVKRHQDAFPFNATFWAHLADLHHSCGFDAYLEKYLTYPPPGPFEEPLPGSLETNAYNMTCDMYSAIVLALENITNFNFYNYTGPLDQDYFSRQDVREAFHVPKGTQKWTECSNSNNVPISLNHSYDRYSLKRTLLAHGLWDFRIFSEGSQLGVQNMTWSGAQGLSKPLTVPFMVKGQGHLGNFRTERGFTLAEVDKAGHMIPQDQPQAALQLLQFLLGQRETPSE